ncbi:MAG TPA: zinc-binding alcohol dehydrogenase family protein [Planctomycetota bacterium]|nr:zinc-binding alcohol dehydrogenase family protein [Planctomycetota bacterium]
MRALRIDAPRATGLCDLPVPAPGPGEVLLRVARVGFCGSDLNTFRGANALVAYPRIPGHEVSGTVVAVGAGLEDDRDAALGRRALVLPYTACGACPSCRAGRPNCCRDNRTLGVQRDGALAEYLVVPVAKLISAPGLDLDALALVEPLTIGFHAVARGRVLAGETVAVFGCGVVGLGAIAGAVARGARVIAVDLDRRKLAIARAVGALEATAATGAALADDIAGLTGGDGPAVCIEAAGHADAFRACIELASFAGRVVAIGYAKAPLGYESRHVILKELDVLGSRNATRGDFDAVLAHLATGRLPLDALISRRVGLDEAGAALAAWDADPGAVTKILVDVG